MDQYDYVWKSYGTSSAWNLAPDTADLSFTVRSYDQQTIVSEVIFQGTSFVFEVRGNFQFQGVPTPALDTFNGTADSLTVYREDQLHFEERLPAGTDVIPFIKGDYAFQLSLLGGNDFFAGSEFRHPDDSDGVRAGDGNDTFIGYGSTEYDDEFYGEAGIDTSIYRGKFSEYTIEWSDNIWDGRLRDGTTTSGYIVTDTVTARDDTDRLVGVERLQFSDVTLALDIDGIAAEAYRIYKAAFDRQPDLTGLGFWIKNMDAGMGLEAVAQEFITSAEFIRMYGANPTDEQFVDLLYANVLDRQADQSGYDFWIGALDRGLTRAGLLAEFSESKENVANVAPLIEDGIQYTAYMS
ncbi:DUF4214 domain-containing protein [Orrella daihaiensis]|uniref:DUF4214 domain-containing protein n=1 Tax=Orrella daihaiensis TaxID=2782176 RepID=A0ABY4AMW2_9BURK|nr:DUF4214 domain-containing protein [Orrella daihaiensis]UOD50407.1 DUF4214 domain-containing protein [Orrella daihaiensis]